MRIKMKKKDPIRKETCVMCGEKYSNSDRKSVVCNSCNVIGRMDKNKEDCEDCEHLIDQHSSNAGCLLCVCKVCVGIESSDNDLLDKPGIQIIGAKVVGLCSEHQNFMIDVVEDKYGNVVSDDQIYCLECNLNSSDNKSTNFEFERMPNAQSVKNAIKECEGKHIQQVAYSTYHDSLTQICFNCKKIRSDLDISFLNDIGGFK